MASDAAQVEIIARRGGVELNVKVVPGASRTRVVGAWNRALKVAVAAPPERGKANDALIKLLAATFDVHTADIAIVSGQTSPLKKVAVTGLTAAAARERLG